MPIAWMVNVLAKLVSQTLEATVGPLRRRMRASNGG